MVHLLNNLFKAGLLRKAADWPTVLRFGVPAVPGALIGAGLLHLLATEDSLFRWSAFGRTYAPSGASVVVGVLMIVFALLELQRWFQRLSAPSRYMTAGGFATGLLGGLTGQQGALRSMFLLKSGLDAEGFIATGVMIAVLIDLSRVPAYAASFSAGGVDVSGHLAALVATGTLSALAGAWLGVRYARKVTIGFVRTVVAVLMLAIGSGLCLGLLGA